MGEKKSIKIIINPSMNFQAGHTIYKSTGRISYDSVHDEPCSCVHAQTHKPNTTNGHRNDEVDGHLGKVP